MWTHQQQLFLPCQNLIEKPKLTTSVIYEELPTIMSFQIFVIYSNALIYFFSNLTADSIYHVERILDSTGS